MTTFQPERDAIRALIAQSVRNYQQIPVRVRESYNESQAQQSLILPLFRALGWNTESAAEMSVEEKIHSQYADFGFYLNGIPVFYLETKRPSESIDEIEHIRQAINYAYLKGVTWAVLTNFKGLAIYNAEWETERPQQALVFAMNADQYANGEFDNLWLLSKAAMQARELDRFAERFGVKRRRQPITDVLLTQLTQWRRDLFSVFTALQANSTLWSTDPRGVDNAIQKLFDRLIFLRAAEDRGIEGAHLKEVMRHPNKAERFTELLRLFREMDGVYNSNLFAEHTLDMLDLYDPDLITEIIAGLYKVPSNYGVYDFRAVSADVLGKVYEGYLGFKAQDPAAKAAHKPRTAKTTATEKSAKRKSQGIFYTPQFVVRYIVQNTLGRLLESGANPHDIRVLDPACGSGSFLIEAFDVLDRWIKQHEPDLPDVERRRRILMENLYGVDLDEQAVEVTQLNLVLRASLERGKLPMLTHIQMGNSLVDDPAVAGVDKAFVWAERFPYVMNAGGFDVVIGNPPYVRQESLGEAFKTYAEPHYATYAGSADLYVYFIEKGVTLLKPGGRFSVIAANKWMRASYGAPLREWLSAQHIDEIIDFGDLPVFADATTYPAILTVEKAQAAAETVGVTQVITLDFADLKSYVGEHRYPVRRDSFGRGGWSLAAEAKSAVLDKMRVAGVPLSEYLNGKIYRGVLTGLNDAFVIDDATRKDLIARDSASADLIKPYLQGRDLRRYEVPHSHNHLIRLANGWTRQESGETDELSEGRAWDWLQTSYPALATHLAPFAERARKRWDKGEFWWELRPCDYYSKFEKPKLIFPDIAPECRFALDTSGNYGANTVYFLNTGDEMLLGVLNSKVVNYYCKRTFAEVRGGYLRFFQQYVETIPIPRLDLSNPTDKARHDAIVGHVTRLIDLKQQRAAELFDTSERAIALDEQIGYHDTQIDQAVYALYGLTDAEIALVTA